MEHPNNFNMLSSQRVFFLRSVFLQLSVQLEFEAIWMTKRLATSFCRLWMDCNLDLNPNGSPLSHQGPNHRRNPKDAYPFQEHRASRLAPRAMMEKPGDFSFGGWRVKKTQILSVNFNLSGCKCIHILCFLRTSMYIL